VKLRQYACTLAAFHFGITLNRNKRTYRNNHSTFFEFLLRVSESSNRRYLRERTHDQQESSGSNPITPANLQTSAAHLQSSPTHLHLPTINHKMLPGNGTGMLGQDGIHIDMSHLKSGEVNLGTSIMAITFADGVILGADSRTTTGAYIANRVTDKLTQVHDTIWCCRSGSAADTQAVADIVQYHLGMYGVMNNEAPTTQTAAALFQELCYDNKDQLR
jgi:hypothetical protein